MILRHVGFLRLRLFPPPSIRDLVGIYKHKKDAVGVGRQAIPVLIESERGLRAVAEPSDAASIFVLLFCQTFENRRGVLKRERYQMGAIIGVPHASGRDSSQTPVRDFDLALATGDGVDCLDQYSAPGRWRVWRVFAHLPPLLHSHSVSMRVCYAYSDCPLSTKKAGQAPGQLGHIQDTGSCRHSPLRADHADTLRSHSSTQSGCDWDSLGAVQGGAAEDGRGSPETPRH